MAIYSIKYTDRQGTPIVIQPGQLNGVGGVSPITDLYLYGQGTLNWGQGVDQNLLRMLESSACPTKPGSNPPRPVNKDDNAGSYVGDNVSSGINNPIKGQLWFNTTDEKMYVCEDPSSGTNGLWKISGADPDLFVPKAGGQFDGPIDIVSNTDPRITLSSGTSSTADPQIQFHDNSSMKGLLALDSGAVDTLIWRKLAPDGSINEIRILDDGVEVVKGNRPNLAATGPGTVRVSETITTAHLPQTLTTKKWVADSITDNNTAIDAVRRNVTSAQTMIGDLYIDKEDPQLRINMDSNAVGNNGGVEWRNLNGLQAAIYIDQVAGGVGQKNFAIQKRDGSTVINSMVMFDDKVRFRGDSNTTPHYIDIHTKDGTTTSDPTRFRSGKITGTTTIADDHGATLTTKNYVDGLVAGNTVPSGTYVSLPSQLTGMTGEYRYGGNNDDTKINKGSVISTVGSGRRTEISGSDVLFRNSSTDESRWNGADFRSTFSTGELTIKGSTLTSFQTGSFWNRTEITQGVLRVQASDGVDTVIDGTHTTVTTGTGNTAEIDGQIIKSTVVTTGVNKGNTNINGRVITSTEVGVGASEFSSDLIENRLDDAYSTVSAGKIRQRATAGGKDITFDGQVQNNNNSRVRHGFFEGTGTSYSDGDKRAEIEYIPTINQSGSSLNIVKYGGGGSNASALNTIKLDDTEIRLHSEGGPTLRLHDSNNGTQSGTSGKIEWSQHANFTPNTSGEILNKRASMEIRHTSSTEHSLWIVKANNAGSNVTTMVFSDIGTSVNRPLALEYDGSNENPVENIPVAHKIFRQDTPPPLTGGAVTPIGGDFWYKTGNGTKAGYMYYLHSGANAWMRLDSYDSGWYSALNGSYQGSKPGSVD